MKKFVLFILIAFFSVAFAEGEIPTPAYYADSVMYADSAKYHEALSNQLKQEGEQLQKKCSRRAKMGMAATLAGAAGTIAVLELAKNTSIEGGGAMVVFLAAPAEVLLFGGIFMLSFSGIDHGKVGELRQQSEDHLEKARQYQEKANKERYRRTSQMMLRVAPQVDPINKSVGGLLAMNF